MAKLSELNAEQTALLPVVRDIWIAIGLATGDCDFIAAKESLKKVYGAAELQTPELVLLADSPLSGAMMASALQRILPLDMDAVIAKELKAAIKKMGEEAVKAEGSEETLIEMVAQQVASVLQAKLDAKAAKDTPDEILEELRRNINTQLYGQHDASWLSFYDYFARIGELPADHALSGLCELAKVCGWWSPYREVAILQHKPDEIHMVDGRLHREDGPSVLYRDGFAVWSIGGVRVDEQIVMRPDTQTIEQIKAEENEEIKRIRIERFGWDRYMLEVGAVCIDFRSNDIEATKEALYRCEGMVLLRTFCPSTGRVYALEVDPTVKSCSEAQSWLWGIENADQAIIGRT